MKIPTKNVAVFLITGIIAFSYFSRTDIFQTQHPNDDELFELRSLQEIKPQEIFKNNLFYGDHTSFPGEYLIEYLPMKFLGLFEHPASIDIEQHVLRGINKNGFWVLALPKILFSLLCIGLFWGICAILIESSPSRVFAWAIFMLNSPIIYHSFSLRPYGILPELSILNIWFCINSRKDNLFSATHAVLLFFTCIYHAYGLLIALLPFIYFRPERPRYFFYVTIGSILIWAHYAVFSNFGIIPNKVQTVMNAFSYMPANDFLNSLIQSLFTGAIGIAILSITILSSVFSRIPEIKFFFWFIILPIALIIAVDIKTSYGIHPRQWVWVIPSLALWSGMVIERLINKLERL